MEARETDKLFREKLKNTVTAPKEDSWTRLESMLEEKNASPWLTPWRVAAAVLLLMVSASVLLYWSTESTRPNELASTKNTSESFHKEVKISPKVNVEPITNTDETEVVLDVEEAHNPSTRKKVKQQTTKKQVIEETIPELPAELILEEHQQLAEVLPEGEIEEPVPARRKFNSIKITYKRGKKPLPKQQEMLVVQQTDTTGGGKIKELWAHTKEIKPGDLWADIRDAKDNLFQKNSKKNKDKNLNK